MLNFNKKIKVIFDNERIRIITEYNGNINLLRDIIIVPLSNTISSYFKCKKFRDWYNFANDNIAINYEIKEVTSIGQSDNIRLSDFKKSFGKYDFIVKDMQIRCIKKIK